MSSPPSREATPSGPRSSALPCSTHARRRSAPHPADVADVEWWTVWRWLDCFGDVVSREERGDLGIGASRRTVGEIREFAASRATVPVVRPMRIAGVDCASAGAFRTIRALRAGCGADPASVRPSARLEAWLGAPGKTPWRALERIAPGRFDPPAESRWLRPPGCGTFLAGILAGLAACVADLAGRDLAAAWCILIGFGCLGGGVFVAWVDGARALAGDSPRR